LVKVRWVDTGLAAAPQRAAEAGGHAGGGAAAEAVGEGPEGQGEQSAAGGGRAATARKGVVAARDAGTQTSKGRVAALDAIVDSLLGGEWWWSREECRGGGVAG